MSKVINFNAREFRLDDTCTSNVGERSYQTTSLGSFEMWEIGNWSWDWTQIVSEKKLEKNTDYIFRFAMNGGQCDTFDATSKFILCGTDGFETLESAWEDRMTFELAQSRYEPIISKRDKTGLLRVFEIPFNTGEKENWRIVFVAMHAVARFFAAPDNSVCEKLEDFTYDDWRREREQQLRGENRNGNFNNSRSDLFDFMKSIINDGKQKHIDLKKNFGTDADNSSDVFSGSGSTLTEPKFAEMLKGLGDGAVASFDGINVISSDNKELYDIGGAIDGAVLDIHDAAVTAKAFSMIIKKLGDGCVVNMSGIKVTTDGLENMYDVGGKSDGMIFTLDGAMLPQKALDLIYSKRGDGCSIYNQNFTVE